MANCNHFENINKDLEIETAETTEGCFECLKINGRWVHLRQCMTCGIVHCCDSSPNQHATKHYKNSEHPVALLLENSYMWCFVDEVAVDIRP